MPERRRHEPAGLEHASAARPAPDSAGLPPDVAKSLGDRSLMGRNDRSHHIGLADPEQHADALRRPERQVEPSDVARPKRAAERLTRLWVAATQQADEPFFAHLAGEASRRGAGP